MNVVECECAWGGCPCDRPKKGPALLDVYRQGKGRLRVCGRCHLSSDRVTSVVPLQEADVRLDEAAGIQFLLSGPWMAYDPLSTFLAVERHYGEEAAERLWAMSGVRSAAMVETAGFLLKRMGEPRQ